LIVIHHRDTEDAKGAQRVDQDARKCNSLYSKLEKWAARD
jgi:hypothetical protein